MAKKEVRGANSGSVARKGVRGSGEEVDPETALGAGSRPREARGKKFKVERKGGKRTRRPAAVRKLRANSETVRPFAAQGKACGD